MRSKPKAILVLGLIVAVGLTILLLSRACQAQEITPTPAVLPGEPVEQLQQSGLLPQQPNSASLALVKTVGLDPIHNPLTDCPTTEFVYASAGTRVYTCYRVANTGTVTMTSHTLVDDQLGTLFSDYEFPLPVGASGLFTRTAIISTTTVNAATWTATDAGGIDIAAASDRAGVFVAAPQALTCGGPAVDFDQGLPPNWQVVNHPDDSPIYWTDVPLSWEDGNYTGGSGDAASVSSRLQNGGSGIYDTELRSPAFSLNGAGAVTLHFLANYQHNASDALDLGISTDGGNSWTTLLHWNNADHGSLQTPPGESVAVDLSAFSDRPSVMLRWRYYNLSGPANQPDLYAQIDDVSLQCETNAAITLTKTAWTDPACEAGAINLVAPGARLTYCYKVVNSGPNTLTQHGLVDSQQGALLINFSFNLIPGASAILPQPVTILTDTVSTATWSASNPTLKLSANSSDTLTIKVGRPVFLPFLTNDFTP